MAQIRPDRIETLLVAAVSHGASDVHIIAGHPPLFRISGQLLDAPGEPILTPEDTQNIVLSLLNDEQQQQLSKERELDFAYAVKQIARFRVNAHWERGYMGLVARAINVNPPTLQALGLNETVSQLTNLHQGLVLVTGPTGCGKSTSLAAMIEQINQTRSTHIITLEDPIEFLFTSNKSIIRQRELHRDFLSFAEALKHIVRQDPNVIMVGEMRDLETIAAALTVAETGHLVLATLHTNGAAETIDRIIDVFPPHQQHQIRYQLSSELRAVISQILIPNVDGGRVAAREILMNTPAVSNLIRENKIAQLKTVMQTSAQEHMFTIDQDLKRLYNDKVITEVVARSYMMNPELLPN
ncbi:MAG: type IV pilus twitching motility protein PilT [Patescibacteria group bacterium]|jgi:twitching motility protein PilT